MKPAISIAALAALALPFSIGCKKDAPTNNDNLQPAVVTEQGGTATPPPGHGAAGHGGAAAPTPASAGVIEGTVKETMNSGGYTYVLVKTATEEVWAAAPETSAVKVGDKASFPGGMAMENFHAASLKRDFPVIYFVSALTVNGSVVAASGAGKASGAAPAKPTASMQVDVKGIPKAKDGKTIGDLFASKAEMKDKPVSVRGLVVKYNAGIMGSNWLHIKDGSGAAGTDDLTVTTQGTAKVGDTVLINGVVRLEKNFGAGYKYDLMVEDAKITVE